MKCKKKDDIIKNYFDKFGNLEELQIYLFFCEKENTQLKRLQKFEVPLQLKQLKYYGYVDILSRDDALCRRKQLKMRIQEDKLCPDMRQWNEFQYEIYKKRIPHNNLGHKLAAQEVIITELYCEIDRYKTIKDRYYRRLQELKNPRRTIKFWINRSI